MRWESVSHSNGTWFWWADVSCDWTAWVIDDSLRRGRETEYRIAASLRTVTFFSHRKFSTFREAKYGAIELLFELQDCPLRGAGHFARKS